MGEVRKNILNRALLNPISVYSGGIPVAGFAADDLADAVAAAGELASVTNPVNVQLAPATYVLTASLSVPEYVSLIGQPGVVIDAVTNSVQNALLQYSHTHVRDIELRGHTTGIYLSVDNTDVVDDCWIEGMTFVGVFCNVGNADYPSPAAVFNVHILNNRLSGNQPISWVCDSLSNVEIIGNYQDEVITTEGCFGLMGCAVLSLGGGPVHSITMAYNNIRVLNKLTSANPNRMGYITDLEGSNMNIHHNLMEYSTEFITPAAAASPATRQFLQMNVDGEVISGNSHALPNQIHDNVFRIYQIGDTGATNQVVTAVQEAHNNALVLSPDLVLSNNLFDFRSTAEAGEVYVRGRIVSIADYNTSNHQIYAYPSAVDGFGSDGDVCLNADVNEWPPAA